MTAIWILLAISFLTTIAPGLVNTENPDPSCLQCICQASSNCDTINLKCPTGSGYDSYCGPFQISRYYWEDGNAIGYDFETCTNLKACAERVIINYMKRYARDCNGDGLIDCFDYAAIHRLGADRCTDQSLYSTDYWQVFSQTQCVVNPSLKSTPQSPAVYSYQQQDQQGLQQQSTNLYLPKYLPERNHVNNNTVNSAVNGSPSLGSHLSSSSASTRRVKKQKKKKNQTNRGSSSRRRTNQSRNRSRNQGSGRNYPVVPAVQPDSLSTRSGENINSERRVDLDVIPGAESGYGISRIPYVPSYYVPSTNGPTLVSIPSRSSTAVEDAYVNNDRSIPTLKPLPTPRQPPTTRISSSRPRVFTQPPQPTTSTTRSIQNIHSNRRADSDNIPGTEFGHGITRAPYIPSYASFAPSTSDPTLAPIPTRSSTTTEVDYANNDRPIPTPKPSRTPRQPATPRINSNRPRILTQPPQPTTFTTPEVLASSSPRITTTREKETTENVNVSSPPTTRVMTDSNPNPDVISTSSSPPITPTLGFRNDFDSNSNDDSILPSDPRPPHLTNTTITITDQCLSCLCESTESCSNKGTCANPEGPCGPLKVTYGQWVIAGKPKSNFQKCASSLDCSRGILRRYYAKHGVDCNSDSDINCVDFALIHKYGIDNCKVIPGDMFKSEYWLNFENCYGFDRK